MTCHRLRTIALTAALGGSFVDGALVAAGGTYLIVHPERLAGGVPTWRFEQADPTLRAPGDTHYVSDHPYQLRDDSSNRVEIMLGRIPARTALEAEIVLDKVRRYERNEAPGQWRRRVAYTAAEGRFGFADHLLELMFQTMIGRGPARPGHTSCFRSSAPPIPTWRPRRRTTTRSPTTSSCRPSTAPWPAAASRSPLPAGCRLKRR